MDVPAPTYDPGLDTQTSWPFKGTPENSIMQ